MDTSMMHVRRLAKAALKRDRKAVSRECWEEAERFLEESVQGVRHPAVDPLRPLIEQLKTDRGGTRVGKRELPSISLIVPVIGALARVDQWRADTSADIWTWSKSGGLRRGDDEDKDSPDPGET